MRLVVATLLLGAGCLARPTGLADDGSDGGPDAATTPWPAVGVTVNRALARDLDGDGDAELLVATDGGVYVLGGGAGFGTGYHTFVATPFPALRLDAADLGGSAAPELAVLGAAGGAGRVLLHEGSGGLGFAATGWARDLPGTAPTRDGGGGVWLLDSDGDGAGNVLAADGETLLVGEPAAWTEAAVFEMALVRAEGANSTFFTLVHDLFVLRPGAGGAGTADLVVDDHHRVSIFRGTGADAYPGTARTDVDAATGMYDVSAHADLDGDGSPELVGGYSGFLGATSLAGTPGDLAYQGPGPGGHPVLVSVSAHLAELDGDPGQRLDLLLVRHIAEAGDPSDTELVLIRNLVLTAGVIDTPSDIVVRRTLPGLVPAVAVGDFDGSAGAEIVAVAGDGTLTCMRAGDGTLDDC